MIKILQSIISCLFFFSTGYAQNLNPLTGQTLPFKTSYGTAPNYHVKDDSFESDNFQIYSQKLYDERKKLFLEFCASNDTIDSRGGIWAQIARLELGFQLDEGSLKASINFVNLNRDCNDFTLGGLLRLLYLYQNTALVSKGQIRDIEECLLDFKYWWNEPGSDYRCYHTENHQIIFHSNQLLAGQLFKDKIFRNNGQNGRMHLQHAKSLIHQWMNWRIKFGFSEWLSNNYFDANFMALANLYDFAEDSTIRSNAGSLLDVLMFEMALHSFHGTFGSTHGRAYARNIKGGRREPSANTTYLMFGTNNYNSTSMGSVSLATSSYHCPKIIQNIATDYLKPIRIRERHSINIDDAYKYGLVYCKESDINLYLSIQDYTHPAIIDLVQQVSRKYRIRNHTLTNTEDNYDNFRQLYQQQIQQNGQIVNSKLDRHAMTEVNIETYRTPEYMLSCAQQFRPGSPGYQQHIWQATLGIDAVVFTNHPGSYNESLRPNYWAGNGILPNAAQYKNVLVSIYNIPKESPLLFLHSEQKSEFIPFSHAYFPKHAFDEVFEKGHWIFGRKDNGYVALYSQNPMQWKVDEEGREMDLIASSRENIWLCELGYKEAWGNFSKFVEAITKHEVKIEELNVIYNSPSQGEIKYGWSESLQVKGEIISLKTYLRFDNPYCQNDFASDKIVIKNNGEEYTLNFKNAER
jgi:hypothetical protein